MAEMEKFLRLFCTFFPSNLSRCSGDSDFGPPVFGEKAAV